MQWSIGGRSAATAATANHVGALFWNPATTKGVWVTALSLFQTTAIVSNPSLKRATVLGSAPAATYVPTIANDHNRLIAPPSGSVLHMGVFGGQPTLEGSDLFKANIPAAIGSGFMMPFPGRGIYVPAASGLAINTPIGVILQPFDCTFFVEE